MTQQTELEIIQEENRLSVETDIAFKELTESEDVFYHYGEGYLIRAFVETEEQFIDFVQKVGLIDLWGHLVPFFTDSAHDFDKWFEYKNTVRRSDNDTVETIQWGDLEPEIVSETFFPTVEKEVLTVSYNQYFDKPYRIRKAKVMVYGPEDIKVRNEIKSKFPCVVTFTSQDTFDRCGTIEGYDLTIIPMSELTNKAVFA